MITASAPVRICDLGGWTDTWFGGPGRVLNLAATPGVEVSVRARSGRGRVVLDVRSFEDRYEIVPGAARPPRHPLLEAAVDHLRPPDDRDLEISVRSAVPAGSGCGTSAAVAVAVLGALSAVRGSDCSQSAIAAAAHRLEVEGLGGESGVQDQLSSAFGGINYLEIDRYPEAAVTPLEPWPELAPHLTLVFLGRAHESSAVHRQVIRDVQAGSSGALADLRAAALAGRRAVEIRDLAGFGDAMIRNTAAQAALHPAAVGPDAQRVIACARRAGSIGWKVNGAGGDGGSLTLMSATADERAALEAQVASLDPAFEAGPVRISGAGLHLEGSL